MKYAQRTSGVLLGIWLILFSSLNATAQGSSTEVSIVGGWGTSNGEGEPLCNITQPSKATCSEKIELAPEEKGKVSSTATANYGSMSGKADASTTDNENSGLDTTVTATSQFTDTLSFPTLPDGTSAVLSATLTLSGSGSASNQNSSWSAGTSIFIAGNDGGGGSCLLSATGTCLATMTVSGGSDNANLSGFLQPMVVASLPEPAGIGTGAASANFTAKITALTLTLASGETCPWEKPEDECYIQTASGHKYPH
jgi:hypothetical protein